MLFENNLITVINKKHIFLYISFIMDYIIENYETMPDKFIFWPFFSNYDIDNKVVNYIKQIDNGENCDLFYISNHITIFDFNKVFASVETDDIMRKKVDFYKYEHLKKIYLLLFGEEICENLIFNYGEGHVMLMNKTKICKNPIDYYKKLLDYFANSENIERDEYYINFFMEKIFTGVFTNNVRVSNAELEAKEKKKMEEETRAREEEEKKKTEEETKKRKAEEKKRIEDEKIKKEEEEAKRKEEDYRKREEEENKKLEEMENLMGPIEEIENLTGSIEVNEIIEIIEIMENDMMFDINIINYVDNTIRLS
jgi:hypothetical protein